MFNTCTKNLPELITSTKPVVFFHCCLSGVCQQNYKEKKKNTVNEFPQNLCERQGPAWGKTSSVLAQIQIIFQLQTWSSVFQHLLMTGCHFFGSSLQQNLRLPRICCSVNGYSARVSRPAAAGAQVYNNNNNKRRDVGPWASTECRFKVSNCLLTDVTNGADPQKKYFHAFSSSCYKACTPQAELKIRKQLAWRCVNASRRWP